MAKTSRIPEVEILSEVEASLRCPQQRIRLGLRLNSHKLSRQRIGNLAQTPLNREFCCKQSPGISAWSIIQFCESVGSSLLPWADFERPAQEPRDYRSDSKYI